MKTKINHLSKLVMFYLMFASTVFSQSITNTLGTGGVFTIKDATNNFFTLSQSTGQVNILRSLRLENTTSSSLGVLFKGTNPFLHNYGTENTFLGINSGNFTMTGIYNTAMGSNSLSFNTTGSYNTAVGWNSLFYNTTGNQNTAVGLSSLVFNNGGNYNTAVGYSTLPYNTSGSFNTAVGWLSLNSNINGGLNTALGVQSLYSNNGGYNTALGVQSLYSNNLGGYNTAVGNGSLYSNLGGSWNTALGYISLFSNISGFSNTAIGHQALYSNTTGTSNTAVGDSSLYLNTSGNGNTVLGRNAGSTITTGGNLTCIGINSQPISGTAINQITLGSPSITALRCAVQTISGVSDARDKKNITDLSLGIDFLMKVKPRLFNWDKREWYNNNVSDGSKMKETPTAGFIAQELDEVQTTENSEWLNLVLKDNPEKLEATSGNLLPVMVKAIQELKEENDLLKQNNEKLSAEVVSFKSINEKLSAEVEAFKSISEKLVKLEQKVNELNSIKHTSFNGNKVSMTNSK